MTFHLPMRVTLDGGPRGKIVPFRAGSFDAGWSVAEYATREERASAMVAFADARMPCWTRIEREPA